MRDHIESKLKEAFTPSHLIVVDESEQHRGHAGYREGGESHFRVEMVATAFDGQSRLSRQRAVFSILKSEMADQIHALSLDLKGEAD